MDQELKPISSLQPKEVLGHLNEILDRFKDVESERNRLKLALDNTNRKIALAKEIVELTQARIRHLENVPKDFKNRVEQAHAIEARIIELRTEMEQLRARRKTDRNERLGKLQTLMYQRDQFEDQTERMVIERRQQLLREGRMKNGELKQQRYQAEHRISALQNDKVRSRLQHQKRVQELQRQFEDRNKKDRTNMERNRKTMQTKVGKQAAALNTTVDQLDIQMRGRLYAIEQQIKEVKEKQKAAQQGKGQPLVPNDQFDPKILYSSYLKLDP